MSSQQFLQVLPCSAWTRYGQCLCLGDLCGVLHQNALQHTAQELSRTTLLLRNSAELLDFPVISQANLNEPLVPQHSATKTQVHQCAYKRRAAHYPQQHSHGSSRASVGKKAMTSEMRVPLFPGPIIACKIQGWDYVTLSKIFQCLKKPSF